MEAFGNPEQKPAQQRKLELLELLAKVVVRGPKDNEDVGKYAGRVDNVKSLLCAASAWRARAAAVGEGLGEAASKDVVGFFKAPLVCQAVKDLMMRVEGVKAAVIKNQRQALISRTAAVKPLALGSTTKASWKADMKEDANLKDLLVPAHPLIHDQIGQDLNDHFKALEQEAPCFPLHDKM